MSKCRHYFPRLVLLPEQEHRLHHLPQYPGLHQGKVGHLPFFNKQPGVSQVASTEALPSLSLPSYLTLDYVTFLNTPGCTKGK